jgi:hypothetical protein
MADAKATKATDTGAAGATDEKPALVAVDAGAKPSGVAGAASATTAPVERRGVSRGLFWTVVGLLVLALVGLAVQTQRARALDARVQGLSLQAEGLRTQLAVANSQIQTYAMTMSLVRGTVADIFEKTALLSELVGSEAVPAPPEPSATPEAP